MLEGNTLPTWWKWNETIGDLKNRPGRAGTWGYPLTAGLGLVEYMQWCEDLDVEPSQFPYLLPFSNLDMLTSSSSSCCLGWPSP